MSHFDALALPHRETSQAKNLSFGPETVQHLDFLTELKSVEERRKIKADGPISSKTLYELSAPRREGHSLEGILAQRGVDGASVTDAATSPFRFLRVWEKIDRREGHFIGVDLSRETVSDHRPYVVGRHAGWEDVVAGAQPRDRVVPR